MYDVYVLCIIIEALNIFYYVQQRNIAQWSDVTAENSSILPEASASFNWRTTYVAEKQVLYNNCIMYVCMYGFEQAE